MGRYLLRRLLLLIPVLLGVSIVAFTLIHAIPGDISNYMIGTDTRISDEQRELVRKSYGLDQPLPVQYAKWMGTSSRVTSAPHSGLGVRSPKSSACVFRSRSSSP